MDPRVATEHPVVLLGAGASVEAGIPASRDMTQKLTERVSEDRVRNGHEASALNFVCGTLMGYDAAQGGDPYAGLDVERVFAAVKLLAERQELEVTPFVSAWHPAVDGWDTRPGRIPAFFDRDLQEAILNGRGHSKAGRLISNLVTSVVTPTAPGETYGRLAVLMLRTLRGLLATTEKRLSYLEPLVAQGRESPQTIATLNYDVGVELASAVFDVPCTTSIDKWADDGGWQWLDRGLNVLKLHGSINWEWHATDAGEGALPRRVVRVVDDPAGADSRAPALVFGQRAKLTAEGPFLALLAEFERHLSATTWVVIVGYSFRDDHVNELLRRWLSEDMDRHLTVIDPAFPLGISHHVGPTDFRKTLVQRLIPSDFGPKKFEARLEVLLEPASVGLRRVFG